MGDMGRFANTEQVRTHLREHIAAYPASKKKIMEACGNCACVASESDRRAFEAALPDRTYKDARSAERALRI